MNINVIIDTLINYQDNASLILVKNNIKNGASFDFLTKKPLFNKDGLFFEDDFFLYSIFSFSQHNYTINMFSKENKANENYKELCEHFKINPVENLQKTFVEKHINQKKYFQKHNCFPKPSNNQELMIQNHLINGCLYDYPNEVIVNFIDDLINPSQKKKFAFFYTKTDQVGYAYFDEAQLVYFNHWKSSFQKLTNLTTFDNVYKTKNLLID